MNLPSEYTSYIHNGGDTVFETDHQLGGYIALTPLDQITQLNREIEIREYAPEFLAFASDGGGEVFVFDSDGKVYLLPLVGMSSDDATKIAESWGDYIQRKIS